MIRLTMNPADWALLVLLSVLWGGSFFFIEVVLTVVPPLTLVALRVSLAAAALWAIVAVFGVRAVFPARIWLAFLVMGLLNNAIPFTLLAFAQVQIASALAAILNATTPLFAVMVAGFLLADEKPGLLKFAGVVIGFAGVVVMIGADVLPDTVSDTAGGVDSMAVVAQLACLGAALSYAFAGAFGRRFQRHKIHPLLTAAGQLTGSSLILWPIALLHDGGAGLQGAFAPVPLLSVLALALASTAFAYVIYFRLLATVGSTNLLLVTFLVPVTASILGIAVLGEKLGMTDLLGMVLIGAGLSAIDGRVWRRASAAAGILCRYPVSTLALTTTIDRLIVSHGRVHSAALV